MLSYISCQFNYLIIASQIELTQNKGKGLKTWNFSIIDHEKYC